jgi:hypothetical protein
VVNTPKVSKKMWGPDSIFLICRPHTLDADRAKANNHPTFKGFPNAPELRKDGPMSKHIDVLLLLALPASGKSEARRYLASLSPEQCHEQFGIGHTVQLDDFPYVHIMRRISDELTSRGRPGAFFVSPALPFRNPVDSDRTDQRGLRRSGGAKPARARIGGPVAVRPHRRRQNPRRRRSHHRHPARGVAP